MLQELRKIKDSTIGFGIKRLKYEAKLAQLRDMNAVEVAEALGLSQTDTILLAEIMAYKLEEKNGGQIVSGLLIFSIN